MAVPSTTRRAGPFTGTGALVSYPFEFKAFDKTDISVVIADAGGIESDLVLDSSVLVTLNSDQEASPGGSVQYAVAGVATALPSGYTLAILSALDYAQVTRLPAGGNYRAESVEGGMDALAIMIQQLLELLQRTLKMSPLSSADIDTVLPAPSANKVLGWNETETGLTNLDPSVLAAIVAFGTAIGDVFTGDGVTTAFTLTRDPGVLYNLDVAIAGSTKTPVIDFNWTSGTTLTFVAPPALGARVYVRYLRALPQAGQVIPDISGQANKVLSNNGSTLDWRALLAADVGVKRYRFAGSGEAGNDRDAFLAYYAALPRHSVLHIDGLVRFTSPVVLGRQISIICSGADDGFIVDVGTGNDGLTIQQATANDEAGIDTVGGVNGIALKLHVFGKANACKNALVVSRLDRSWVHAWVYAGAVNYGLVVDGCLINTWDVQSSIYVRPPIASYAFQVDHMLVQENVAYTVAANRNKFSVNLEGARHGYVGAAMPNGQGYNEVFGEIEALTGSPFIVTTTLGLSIHHLSMEVCGLKSTFDACELLNIGPSVENFASTLPYVGPGLFEIRNSQGVKVDVYEGSLDIDDSNIGVDLGNIISPLPDSHRLTCRSMVQTGVFTNSTTRTTLGGPGAPTMENVFQNPYLDLYAIAGTSAPPLGCTSTAVFINRVTTPLYPGNPTPYSCRVTTAGSGIGDGLIMSPSFNPVQEDGYMSAFVPVYVAVGQPGAICFIFNGVTFFQIGAVVGGDDAWHEFRGSAPMLVGQNVKVYVMSWNGTTYVNASQFYVGGCSMCFGPIPPKHLADHGKRRANIISTVANTPDFSGQTAITGGGIYMAQGNASSADWKLLS